jgi:2-polyprenyl-6-methoxyphenol hydroxylase-like FAD-dependent oxidoreductase
MKTTTTEVLIVGAGPTGLTLACVLRRYGVACRVVEKQEHVMMASRGKGLQPRSLEVLEDLGVIERILARGSVTPRVQFHSGDRLLFDLDLSSFLRPVPGVPYTALMIIPEWAVEETLCERLLEAGVAVERGTTFVDLRDEGESVVVTVDRAGEREEIRAAYLIGCDGGHSAVRKRLGLGFEGVVREEHFVLGDVRIEGLEPGDCSHVWLESDGGLIAAGKLPGTEAWQVIATMKPGPAGEVEPASLELFQRLFVERTGRREIHLSDPTWLSNYRVNARIVDHYRKGRVFVAGDAAHVHSPAGGQGMNTGIQDGYNLGWKLAWVLQGKVGEALLDTYEEERRPVAEAVLRGTGTGHTLMFSPHPVATFLRDYVAVPVIRVQAIGIALNRKMAQLNVGYRGTSLAGDLEAKPRQLSLMVRGQGVENLADWARFHGAPNGGDRAPDARCVDRTGASARVFDRLRGPHFTLLLFGGRGASSATWEQLGAIAAETEVALGADVRSVYVAGKGEAVLAAPDAALIDAEGEAEALYGVSAPSVYLVRPDGYVAFRMQPPTAGAVTGYLRRKLGLLSAHSVEVRARSESAWGSVVPTP